MINSVLPAPRPFLAVLLCIWLPHEAFASDFGSLINQGNSAFEKAVQQDRNWLKKERAADERRRRQAEENARIRAEEARRHGTTYAAPDTNSSDSGSTAGSKPAASQSAGTSGTTKGVRSITSGGRVAGTSNTAHRITCNNGQEYRIWRSGEQWWDGRGALGGQYRDLREEAERQCR